jgi:hypothetical protein
MQGGTILHQTQAGRMWTAGRWLRNPSLIGVQFQFVHTQPTKWLVKIKCLPEHTTRICFPGNQNDVISHLTPLTDECKCCSLFRHRLQFYPDMRFQALIAVLNYSGCCHHYQVQTEQSLVVHLQYETNPPN